MQTFDGGIESLKKKFEFDEIFIKCTDGNIDLNIKIQQNRFLAYKLKDDSLVNAIQKEFLGILLPYRTKFNVNISIVEEVLLENIILYIK